jgi:hypothetical protein
VLEGDDCVEAIVRTIGHEALYSEAMAALTKRVEAAGIDTLMTSPVPDDPEFREYVDNAMLSRAIEWGHAGYLLGLGSRERPRHATRRLGSELALVHPTRARVV